MTNQTPLAKAVKRKMAVALAFLLWYTVEFVEQVDNLFATIFA